jgi:hypothetical protein
VKPENRCRRETVVKYKYMCGGITGCAYFKQDRNKRNYKTARCEYYLFGTGECVCLGAQADVDKRYGEIKERHDAND